jgi:hypothetical protein
MSIEEDTSQANTNEEVNAMQTRLSPAHRDFDKVGFAELEDRIRKRAFQLYEKRGHVNGYALNDWLEAKAEVLGVTKGESYLENVPPSRKAGKLAHYS